MLKLLDRLENTHSRRRWRRPRCSSSSRSCIVTPPPADPRRAGFPIELDLLVGAGALSRQQSGWPSSARPMAFVTGIHVGVDALINRLLPPLHKAYKVLLSLLAGAVPRSSSGRSAPVRLGDCAHRFCARPISKCAPSGSSTCAFRRAQRQVLPLPRRRRDRRAHLVRCPGMTWSPHGQREIEAPDIVPDLHLGIGESASRQMSAAGPTQGANCALSAQGGGCRRASPLPRCWTTRCAGRRWAAGADHRYSLPRSSFAGIALPNAWIIFALLAGLDDCGMPACSASTVLKVYLFAMTSADEAGGAEALQRHREVRDHGHPVLPSAGNFLTHGEAAQR